MQSSLHINTQTRLHASAAKSFAMKKTIAAQVRAYINAQGDAYTPAKLADEGLPDGNSLRKCLHSLIIRL